MLFTKPNKAKLNTRTSDEFDSYSGLWEKFGQRLGETTEFGTNRPSFLHLLNSIVWRKTYPQALLQLRSFTYERQ